MTSEVVADPGAALGEGPLWDVETQRLLWLDIAAGDVHELDPLDGAQQTWHVGGLVGAMALADDGGLVLGVDGRLVAFDRATGAVAPLARVAADADVRCNDGGVDPQGRMLVGTMSISGVKGAGGLYRLEDDLRIRPLLEGVTISNGLAWDAAGTRLHHIDSPTGRVRAYEYDSAGVREHGPDLDVRDVPGMPDGMAIDAAGRLWIAFWGGSEVRCFDPTDGRELERLQLPVDYVTSCAFGGPALDELYVTTARWDLPAGEQPLAGAVFRFRPGATGLPPRRWSRAPESASQV